jgi:hypothetical protein
MRQTKSETQRLRETETQRKVNELEQIAKPLCVSYGLAESALCGSALNFYARFMRLRNVSD